MVIEGWLGDVGLVDNLLHPNSLVSAIDECKEGDGEQPIFGLIREYHLEEYTDRYIESKLWGMGKLVGNNTNFSGDFSIIRGKIRDGGAMTIVTHEVEQIHNRIVALLEAQTPELAPGYQTAPETTCDHVYRVSTSACHGILKSVAPEMNRLPDPELITLLDLLAAGRSHEEKIMLGMLLRMRCTLRGRMRPAYLRRWLIHFSGCAQVDSLCQDVFTSEEILTDWNGWQELLEELSLSADPREQRAGLTLLAGPVRRARDERLLTQARETLDAALETRDPLVTSAVGRLLGGMVRMYPAEVERFILVNESELSRSILREVRRRLETGDE